MYTCLTQLHGGRDMYNLLHKKQLHVSALFIGHLQVEPEDGQWKGPKHVVVLYVINYTYLYQPIVVSDKYTHSNLVYYKHNGDDEPYALLMHIIERIGTFQQIEKCRHSITIRGRSCRLSLIASIALQNGWKHLWQENSVAFASIIYAWIVSFLHR